MAQNNDNKYNDDSIQGLEGLEAVRKRPGMYIGSTDSRGLHHCLTEIIDNSIDEFMMGNGRKIEVKVSDEQVSIRDYGRGIPLGKVVDVTSKMNTGAKYDSKAFKKSVGLNGVGIKAVNALSSQFLLKAFRDGEVKEVEFSKGIITREENYSSHFIPVHLIFNFL